MRSILAASAAAVLALVVGALLSAEIKSLTLEELVRVADGAVYGQITGARVFRVDSPIDGPELYYTRLTIVGRTLASEQPITLDVTFRGGFVSATEGVYNSDAPAADDVQIGKRVVAFYRWTDDMGGGVPANALVASHGGIYRTVDGPRGPAVLGRGPGYAISANVRLEQLTAAVRAISAATTTRR